MTPSRCYFICTEPRTGGHYLGECLRRTSRAGKSEEYFWRDNEPGFQQDWGTENFEEFVREAFRAGTSENGVFGAKIGYGGGAWTHFIERLKEISPATSATDGPSDLIASVFPDLKYIFLTRRNKVRQAVSWWRAIQTGFWSADQAKSGTPRETPEYRFSAIDHLVQEIVMREAAWQEYFSQARITPLALTYEDLVADPQSTTMGVLAYIGIALPDDLTFGDGPQQKQADEVSETWVQKYREEKQLEWREKGW